MSIKSIITVGLLAGLAASAWAAPLSSVVVFGDSLSDTGLAYQAILASRQETVPPAPYFEGRFSNGPVAVEIMAAQLGLPLQSLAYGGATTGTGNILDLDGDLDHTGLQDQIDAYIQGGLDPNALLVLWAGTNDFIMNTDTMQGVVGNLSAGMNKLAEAGGRHFFIPAMPDMSAMPMLLGKQRFRDLSLGFNASLNQASQLFLQQHPDLDVRWFDTPLVLDGLKNSTVFSDTTHACIAGDFYAVASVCGSPESFMFWDRTHFSAATHQVLGTAFAAAVPEPSGQTLFALGLVLLVMTWTTRQQS